MRRQNYTYSDGTRQVVSRRHNEISQFLCLIDEGFLFFEGVEVHLFPKEATTALTI